MRRFYLLRDWNTQYSIPTGRTAPIPIEHKQDVLGVGKQQVDTWYNETSTAKRKTTEVERQAEETEEARVRREVINQSGTHLHPILSLGETHASHCIPLTLFLCSYSMFSIMWSSKRLSRQSWIWSNLRFIVRSVTNNTNVYQTTRSILVPTTITTKRCMFLLIGTMSTMPGLSASNKNAFLTDS